MLAEHEMQKASREDSMARVRIGDVAREAGVSLGTVSNALNHPEKVRPETRRVINETIERLGYLPNQARACSPAAEQGAGPCPAPP